jgi:hypothetical protein
VLARIDRTIDNARNWKIIDGDGHFLAVRHNKKGQVIKQFRVCARDCEDRLLESSELPRARGCPHCLIAPRWQPHKDLSEIIEAANPDFDPYADDQIALEPPPSTSLLSQIAESEPEEPEILPRQVEERESEAERVGDVIDPDSEEEGDQAEDSENLGMNGKT